MNSQVAAAIIPATVQVTFRLSEFLEGSLVAFDGAEFSRGSRVSFGSAMFTGGQVTFDRVKNWSYPPEFDWDDKPPAGVVLPDSASSGKSSRRASGTLVASQRAWSDFARYRVDPMLHVSDAVPPGVPSQRGGRRPAVPDELANSYALDDFDENYDLVPDTAGPFNWDESLDGDIEVVNRGDGTPDAAG